jgi:serine/threonine-protein kinase
MFLDEARLAATLHHHHVVQVYDVGQDGSEYFFAMEYVHGEDLRHILSASSKRRELIRLDYALAIIQAAAAGLDYAHNQCDSDGRPLGIVHRDVSPSNILVGYDGSVKLVDFGIAKATSRPGETQVGVLKGKISYLSPEQLRSAGVDRRSDVFSLGIVLFELSTTKRLFRGASEFETMHRILTGDVPRPSAVIPGYPSELEQIVLRALSVDPGERQQSAGELASELDAFAHRARLAVSSSALGRWITELFGKRPEPWTVATRSPANTEEAWTILDGTVSDADGGAMDLAPATAATPVPSAPGPPAPAIVTGPILRPMLDDSPVQTPPARARPDTTRHSTLQRMRPRSRRSGQLPMIIALVVTGLALVGGAMFLQQRAPRAPTPTARPSP